jgi:hypothetical protein
MNTDINPAYEADLANRRQAEAARNARQEMIREQRRDVEEAIALDHEASGMEGEIQKYDDPSTGFQDQVRKAKLARTMKWTLVVACLFAGNVDFWLATPDLATELANKAMPMVIHAAPEGTPTPIWLRVVVGLFITGLFLGVTAGVKKLSDPTDQRQALGRLQPGDDHGFRSLRNIIWGKRGIKAAYLLVLVGIFCTLYSYDIQRARIMDELASLATQDAAFANEGTSIKDGKVSTQDSVPASGGDSSTGEFSFATARPALIIYTLLWLCHLILISLPAIPRDVERSLAGFNPRRVAAKVSELRVREGTLLRDVLLRINEAAPEHRDALIREAQPVAERINVAARRPVMEVQTSQQPASTPEADSVFSDPSRNGEDDAAAPSMAGTTPRGPTPPPPPSHNEDPYEAIFGRVA